MNLRPTFDRLFVRKLDAPKQGLIVLTNSDERILRGVILDIGPDVSSYSKSSESAFKVGMTVYFSKFAGVEVSTEERTLLLEPKEILLVEES